MPRNQQQINEILFWKSKEFTAAAEKTSVAGSFVGVQGAIFYLVSKNQAGIYRIDVCLDGQWEELAEGTCKKDKLTIVDIDFFVPVARVRFTPSAIGAILTAKAWGYPAVYTRGPYDPESGAGGAGD